jgi:hypothetical protein
MMRLPIADCQLPICRSRQNLSEADSNAVQGY